MRHHHISSGSLGGSNVAPIKARFCSASVSPSHRIALHALMSIRVLSAEQARYM